MSNRAHDWYRQAERDLDLLALVKHSALPFERRSTPWDLSALPVPADLIVYTVSEWSEMQRAGNAFVQMVSGQIQ